MPPVRSSGVLLFRRTDGGVQVLLGHMGGPFWAKKDDGAWSIPKGEHDPDEDAEAAAREFAEELGVPVPATELDPARRDPARARCSPPGRPRATWTSTPSSATPSSSSGRRGPGGMQEFPEIDRAAWFDLETARAKVVAGQRPFLDRLLELLTARA